MKELKIIFPFLLVALLLACTSGQGNRVVGDKLSVYFDRLEDEKIAEDVALYWKENDFITGNQQDLKIINGKDKVQLLLIEKDIFKSEDFPFSERRLLNDLRNDLQEKIFHKKLEIIICNEKFEPKYIIN